ncbi:MAG: glycine cleavage system protein GcvH [Deltaproteobacteria bacterium]|nr:glycine cleavage system protein GcvH [Deltaproteobacteria bacterium]
MDFPKDLRYTKDHEWARSSGGKVTVGVTAFAVEQLGDITMVELPKVGAKCQAGQPFGTIESVKSVSDLYAPVSGTVTKINDRLEAQPELVNDACYGDGWLVELEVSAPAELDKLMDAPAYQALVAAAE